MPVSVDLITLHTYRDDDPDLSWLEQDGFDDQGERRQAFADGEWSMVGVRAIAHLTFHYGSVGKSETGRTHQCGLVTADGVTEHLGAYADRCGK